MCAVAAIPVALQWVLAATTVATGVMSAQNTKEEAKIQAGIEENNARLAAAQADAAQAAGDRESQAKTWETRQQLGTQRAAIAASGLDPVFGTPSDIQSETAMFGEIDQQAIRLGAAQQAYGFTSEATQYQNRANLTRWSGKQRARATILGSLAQAGGQLAGGGFGGSGARIGGVQRQAIPLYNPGVQV